MGSDNAPVLIVVGGAYDPDYRRYCLQQAAAGYRLALISPDPPTWQRPFIVDHERSCVAQEEAVVEAGRALAARHPVAGVVTWDEYALESASRLAAELGLPANSPRSARACRDKTNSRRLFAEHGVPSADSTSVRSLTAARRAADAIGYPVVVKPSGGAGSLGVMRVDGPADLRRAFNYASHSSGKESQVLVEEYLDGPEISVECVTHHGATTPVAVTRKDLSAPPYFEEVGHTVDARDPLLPVVAPVASAALAAVGVTHGVSHVEMRLTPSGPKLIEVNARLAGDMIGRLVQLATGVDLVRAAADLAAGARPVLTVTRERSAAIRIFYPPRAGTLTQNRLAPAVRQAPWLHELTWHARVGDRVAPLPHTTVHGSRLGFAVVTGAVPDQAHKRLDQLEEGLVVSVEPDRAGARP